MYINMNVMSISLLLGQHLGTDRLNFLEHAFDLRTIQREEFCADELVGLQVAKELPTNSSAPGLAYRCQAVQNRRLATIFG